MSLKIEVSVRIDAGNGFSFQNMIIASIKLVGQTTSLTAFPCVSAAIPGSTELCVASQRLCALQIESKALFLFPSPQRGSVY